MTLGLVGRKVGMTRVFTDEGDTIPVTVVDVSNNRVMPILRPTSPKLILISSTEAPAAIGRLFQKP